jgi:signal transduction histidine kinase
MEKICLVLDQYRNSQEYNDFTGKLYHFPSKYLNFFKADEIEFIYYEPKRNGKGVFFGSGKIRKKPVEDKRETSKYYVEIEDYKPFKNEVPFENEDGPRETAPYYNPQNAVRQIKIDVLEEICLDGGIRLNFQADAHLMKVLGEELIATEKVGILELIKNAYDARASYCNIIIEKVPELVELPSLAYKYNDFDGPVIVIEDDGIGMDKDTIEKGWLRPASTLKTNIKEKIKKERSIALSRGQLGTFDSLIKSIKKENGGRLPVGEKGVGRFATRRLGSKLILKTKVERYEYEYILEIDWDKFDRPDENLPTDLDSIGVHLTRSKPSRDYGKRKSGTQLIIYGGRPGFSLNENLINDINRTILQMKSPYKGPEDFSVSILCPQLPYLEKELISDEFEPIFSFNGIVNEQGLCDFELSFNPPRSVPLPQQNTKKKDYDLRTVEVKNWQLVDNKLRIPKCGQFYINLNAWYRARPWIEGPKENTFKEYLEQFGGISIYRDGLNVFSSEVGSKLDWLDLSNRHIKSGRNISYYNFIGSIELDQTSNIDLIDKTNREGLLNNAAFDDLTLLTKAVILFIEIHYKSKREEYNNLSGDILKEPKKIGDVSRQAALIINRMVDQYKDLPMNMLANLGKEETVKEKLIDLGSSLKKMEKSLKAMQHVQDLLTEQAGYGLAVSVSVHEIEKLTSGFYNKVLIVSNGGQLSFKQQEDLKSSLESLRDELRRLSPLRAIRNEAKQEFNVTKSFNFIREVFRKKLEKAGIEFIIDTKKGIPIYARYGALNQVIANLVDNSIYWIEANQSSERVIKIRVDEEYRMVLIADSNGDIDESILPHIFEPGYSLKAPQSGLGLYICKYYIFDMKGNIYLAPKKERISELSGAQFILDFSKTPAKKEGEK